MDFRFLPLRSLYGDVLRPAILLWFRVLLQALLQAAVPGCAVRIRGGSFAE